jgi:hypothetical protein
MLALPAALVCAAIVHAPALRMFFAQDDVTFLDRARGLEPTPWSLARPLSEGWTWRLMNAAFGLHPLPYHLVTFGLHLANTALVYGIGLRLLRGRGAAFAAALLFGVSSIAFTPLHWTSCIVELMSTTFTLAAFLAYLVARDRGRMSISLLGALFVLAALTSKESPILLPLVLVVAHLRLEPERPSPRALIAPSVAAVVYAIAFVATLRFVHFARSETYSMSHSPLFVSLNFATYMRWLVMPWVPLRDAMAAMDPRSGPVGFAVAIAIALLLWTQRREPRHPEEVGAAWFLAFLAPVVALQYHTYLYYLYLPWAGLCWLLASLGQRLARGRGASLAPAFGLALLAVTAIEYRSVRAREHAMLGNFPADKTVREGMMLANAIASLDTMGLKPGDAIAFVNSAPLRHVAVADTSRRDTSDVSSYVPLEGTLRHGAVIRLFYPGVRYLGFGRAIPREWEDATTLLYQDEGTLRRLGRGGQAQSELGYFTLRTHQWKLADEMFQRSRALGDTLPDATYGLIVTSDFLGRPRDSERYAAEFLRRWPGDPRAKVVAGGGR